MIFTGLGILTHQRLTNREVFGTSGYSDWFLLGSIFLLTCPGSLVEWAVRLTGALPTGSTSFTW
ncbi:MAG: hypothetical protein R2751_19845 [Bacteroidales bacterium]